MKGAHKKIADMLISQGYVSNFHVIDSRITTRLSSVIERLRKAGWVISTEIQPNKDCRYKLVSTPEALKCDIAQKHDKNDREYARSPINDFKPKSLFNNTLI